MDNRIGFQIAPTPPTRARDFIGPAYVPDEYHDDNVTKTIHIDIGKNLLDALEKAMRRGRPKLNQTQVIREYLQWVVGVDCPDSPYISLAARQQLQAEDKKGQELPRFFQPI